MKAEPAGLTDDLDVWMALSIMDDIFHRLALDYLPFEVRAPLGIYSAEEFKLRVSWRPVVPAPAEPADVAEVSDAESLKATPAVETPVGDGVQEPVVQATAKLARTEVHTSAELLEVITALR